MVRLHSGLRLEIIKRGKRMVNKQATVKTNVSEVKTNAQPSFLRSKAYPTPNKAIAANNANEIATSVLWRRMSVANKVATINNTAAMSAGGYSFAAYLPARSLISPLTFKLSLIHI